VSTRSSSCPACKCSLRRLGLFPTGEYAQLELPGVSYGTAKGAFLIRQLIDANYDGWSIFVAGGMHTADSSWQPIEGYPQLGGYRLWPLGMVMQILRVESRINLDK
jgi:hypothetical protein